MKLACAVCGSGFNSHKRKTKSGAERISKCCSIRCHVLQRNYFGRNNPNYRGTNIHTCAHCAEVFEGQRPKGYYERIFCSSRCNGLANKNGYNRRDLNEPKLLEVAAKLGGIWYQGPPLDGWLWHRKTGFIPIEIKQPRRKGQAHEFTRLQKEFFDSCKRQGAGYLVWHTQEDVVRDLGGEISA